MMRGALLDHEDAEEIADQPRTAASQETAAYFTITLYLTNW
jgi:hypothetical protein